MTEIEEIMAALRRFTDERDWEQFHDGKNLALALSIEAAELNEAFCGSRPRMWTWIR